MGYGSVVYIRLPFLIITGYLANFCDSKALMLCYVVANVHSSSVDYVLR